LSIRFCRCFKIWSAIGFKKTADSNTSINAPATLTDPWRSRSTVQNACNVIADYSEKSCSSVALVLLKGHIRALTALTPLTPLTTLTALTTATI